MYIDFKKILSVAALLILGAVIGITGFKLVENFKAPKQTVSIVGTGEVDATTDLTLILDPIKNIEKVYEVVSQNKNSQITSSYYSLKNIKVWETKAKEEALKDTRNQVESIAKINHLKVGKLLSLEDTNNPRPFPLPMEATSGDASSMMKEAQFDSGVQEALPIEDENVYYNEQLVKITALYTDVYELY